MIHSTFFTIRITFFLLALAALAAAQGPTITTVAGNGTQGYSGDGGQATSAAFNQPVYVAVDPDGNLFIADSLNHRVRKVDASGTVTTYAGNGAAGFSGDGGPAGQASLNGPLGVCLDTRGNVYIADEFNARIRRVDASGAITTVAGNGIRAYGGDGGPAAAASLFIGIRCAVDSAGNLYIAEQGAHRIRRVDPGGTIVTYAGSGSQGFSGDGGPATSAALNNPTAVATDASGNVYFADQFNHRVRKVTTSGIISTIAGNGAIGFSGEGGPATSASLNFPGGLVVDGNGDVYFSDDENNRIRKITPGGTISTVAGNGTKGFSGDGGPATSAMLRNQFGVALDAAGNLYIADTLNHRVRKVSGVASGLLPSFTANNVSGVGGFGSGVTPGGIATIAGANLSVNLNGTVTASQVPLPLQLAGVSVGVDEFTAPLFSVANTAGQEQITLQMPFEVAGRSSVSIVVNNGRNSSAGVAVPVLAAQPSIVTLDGITGSVLHDSDGTLVSAVRPASTGELLVLFVRGLGAVDPAGTTGAPAPTDPLSQTTTMPQVTMDGKPAAISFSGLTPGFIGMYQIKASVPDGASSGLVDVLVSSNGVASNVVKTSVR